MQSPLFLFHVVQEGVGLDRIQTLNYYFKLSPLNIIPCWPDYLPCYPLKWPPFCGQVSGVYK
jgi:hypothetical protein